MPSTEIDLADRIDTDIDQLVDQGEFVNREQAVEELLTLGLSAYGPAEEDETEQPGEDVFNQHLDEQQDPAAMGDDTDDERPL